MCGIAGICVGPEKVVDPAKLKSMCDSIFHRGPDDEGYHVDGNVGIAMRRLSIIDLQSGKQPIRNENGAVWVVLNGEIYNYRALREKLEHGHVFYTNSDTEVIVHLYEEYGERFVDHLNGMFAIALWDQDNRVLYVVRDRLGIKPLYYYERGDTLIFCSELRGILAVLDRQPELDPVALDCYLSYLYVPAPLSIYREIRKLPPGHLLRITGEGREIRRYWELRVRPVKRSEQECVVEFREVFRRAVARHLVSDVPLGAFLSGGIDSSAVVAEMARIHSKPVETFSIGYGGGAAYYDERKYARLVAARYGTHHHEFELDHDVVSMIPKVVESLEEPLADASALPNYFLSHKTREYVTVALSGLGADEFFGGYPRYVGIKLLAAYRKIPRLVRERIIEDITFAIPDSKKGRRFVDRAKRFVKAGNLPADSAYFSMISAFDADNKRLLIKGVDGTAGGTSEAANLFSRLFAESRSDDVLDRVMHVDIKLYMVDDLLTLTDKMSMAHSLEVRVPFLDQEIIEFMETVPPGLKINRFTKKHLLKIAFEGLLPAEILHKEKKGFSVPLTLWFRDGLRSFVRSFLNKERIDELGYFNWEYIRNMVDDHFARKANYYIQIWSLIVFCVWHDIYIAGKQPAECFSQR